MKTLAEIKVRAHGMALMHFYSDIEDKIPCDFFEGYSDEWIEKEVERMTDMLVGQMLWSQS